MQRLTVVRAIGPGQFGMMGDNSDGWFSFQSSVPGWPRFCQACSVGKL